ncbi:unnamed protein product [Dicrocoelium dendriticum]|nr:unnamed protein product [Dicrocoelium dendriticum]
MKLNLFIFFDTITQKIHSSRPSVQRAELSNYRTRNNNHNKVKVKRSRTKLSDNFFLNRYSILWNRLPSEIRAIQSGMKFRHVIHSFLNVETAIGILQPTLTSESPYEIGARWI